jgi:hypothetical protein
MTTSRTDRSVSRRAALAGLGAGSLGVALAAARPAAAQDTTAAHPLVGAWRYANDPTNPANVSVGAFHADGTYVVVFGDIGTGIGVWRATGDRTAEATSIKLDTNPDRNVSDPGTITDRVSIEVDATGNALTAATIFTVRDPAETVLFEASYTATATRIELESAAPGTPASGTPAS